MPTLKVAPEHEGLRLDVYLTQVLPDIPSRSFIKKVVDAGHVTLKKKPIKAGYKIEAGDEIDVVIPDDLREPSEVVPEDIPLEIFYEDQDLIIINKPIGMVVHPAKGNYTGTLVNALVHHCQQLSDVNESFRPGIVHRLDEETSGLIIVAKHNIAHTKLAKQFARHEVQKKYVALVEGNVEFDERKIDEPLARHPKYREKRDVQYTDDAKEAVTFYRVIKRANNVTLVALFPKTGRTHQLRVHMAHIGHPILGDEKYGHKATFPRMALHAQSIGFKHPTTKEFIEFSSKIPQEFLDKARLK
jgi:23S rRNA pseudouridine1911/1915/1917 synthase